jgi:DNA end-binding protein Ku
MPRALWKGAITFGLVHIPVALYPAARENRVDFDWLDKRDMKPVGYKRINKATGKEVTKEDIVKGIEVEDGRYVVLTDEEIKSARPEKTQTVDIVAFVEAKGIAPPYFDSPYVLAPTGRGEKVYLLLREALKETGRVGVATVVIQTKQHLALLYPQDTVVIQTKQHLALLYPQDNALMLNTLRWHAELRSMEDMGIPGKAGGKLAPSERELKMAEQLIADMSSEWDPEQYHDHTREEIMALVQEKMDKGEIKRVEAPAATDEQGAEIIDLTELLKRSLGGKARGSQGKEAAKEVEKPARKTAARAAPAKKAASHERAAAKDAPKKTAARKRA